MVALAVGSACGVSRGQDVVHGPPDLAHPTTAQRLLEGLDAAARRVGDWASDFLQPWARGDRPPPEHLLPDPGEDVPKLRRFALPGDVSVFDGCLTPADGVLANSALDLRQAVEIALCRNPQTRQAWASVVSQGAQIGVARAAFMPSLSIGGNRSRDDTDTVIAGSDGLHSGNRVWATGKSVSFNWILFDLGTRRANLEQARQSFHAALASQDAM
jgi:hypothetical protein